MDFGRLPTLNGLDLSLPPDDPATLRVLRRTARQGTSPIIRLGAPTFANKPWLGSYYPAGTKDANLLQFYSRLFPTLELNSTHYGLPDASTIARWRQLTPPSFRFCPKLPQQISHDFGLGPMADPLVREFGQWLLLLGDRVGHPFLQLPPTFGPTQFPSLERFISIYKDAAPEMPLAVELRHPLWFSSQQARDSVFSMLEAMGITAVISDVAGRRDVLHLRLTTAVAFIRFNAHNLHPTDYTRIDAWVERLTNWYSEGLQELYFFVHQPDIRHTPVLLQYLTEQLNTRLGLRLPIPRPIQPVQGRLF
jgi:uncharacterized protein YecE (DUF72 family)